MKVPVTHSFDLSNGISFHDYIPIAAPMKPPTPAPAAECIVTAKWPPGVSFGSAKFTTSVLAHGFTIALDEHDVGKMIPQFTMPPENVALVYIIPKSSRKVVLTAAKVRMQGKGTACTGSSSTIPYLTCGEPTSMPATLTYTNLFGNVRVGANKADLAGALVMIVGTMGVDLIVSGVEISEPNKAILKSALMAALQFQASKVQHDIDPTYPYKTSFKYGHGISSYEVKAQWGSHDKARNPDTFEFKKTTHLGVRTTPTDAETSVGGVEGSTTVTLVTDAGDDPSKEGLTILRESTIMTSMSSAKRSEERKITADDAEEALDINSLDDLTDLDLPAPTIKKQSTFMGQTVQDETVDPDDDD